MEKKKKKSHDGPWGQEEKGTKAFQKTKSVLIQITYCMQGLGIFIFDHWDLRIAKN